jgi:hypothetical protein
VLWSSAVVVSLLASRVSLVDAMAFNRSFRRPQLLSEFQCCIHFCIFFN